MDAKLELITPEVAKELLANAKKNRNLNEKMVRRFAMDLEALSMMARSLKNDNTFL